MEKNYTYKKQGDGRDSWTCEEFENGILTDKYMVYENPFEVKAVNISNIDIDNLTDEQLLELKQRLGL